MRVLLRFSHGFGDAVQLTCVLEHLGRHRPDWVIDVAAKVGKHTAFNGLCRQTLVLDRDPIDEGQYRWVQDLGWYECYSVYADSPCTKVCNTLREVFGIVPELDLLKYHIQIGDESRQLTRDYLSTICGTPNNGDRFPVVAIHYEGNTSCEKKNLPHEVVAELCSELRLHGYIPLILDWDRRSPLPDQKTVFCPGVGPGDLWGNTGTGDAERLAALLSQCALVIGIDSGPLHVAGATETPTLGVWTGHHPVQFYDLCPNVTHLVPDRWRTIPPCQNAVAARFFEDHYQHRIYDELKSALIRNTLEMLERNAGVPPETGATNGRGPAHHPALPRISPRIATLPTSTEKESPMTTTATALTWELLPGLAREIALGADGSAWCLAAGQMPTGGSSIHRWNGAEWDHVEGIAVKIAVGPNGQLVVINGNHEILTLTPTGWQQLPGLAREIAIGADGSAWCLSTAEIAPGGASIHAWNGHDWDHVEGAAVKIAVGPDGQPWILNSAGQVFRRSGEGWELMPGLASEVACGADGSVWCLSSGEMPAGGHSIHRWNGADWDHVPGAAVRIAAGAAGAVWIANAECLIFRGG